MAEAPWPAVAGISQPEVGFSSLRRSSSSELPPCTARPDLSTKHTPNFSWFFFGQPRVQPWPETPSPTATLTVALGRNCYGLKWPAWHPWTERGRRDGPNPTGLVADLGRSRRRWLGQVSAKKSTISSAPALTRAQYPKRKFPKMEISQNGNHVKTLKSELP